MATRCKCEACQLEHEARQIGEDEDCVIHWVAQRQEQYGENDQHVVAGWKLIDEMDAQMQELHSRAKVLRRQLLAEHAAVHHEYLRGA